MRRERKFSFNLFAVNHRRCYCYAKNERTSHIQSTACFFCVSMKRTVEWNENNMQTYRDTMNNHPCSFDMAHSFIVHFDHNYAEKQWLVLLVSSSANNLSVPHSSFSSIPCAISSLFAPVAASVLLLASCHAVFLTILRRQCLSC